MASSAITASTNAEIEASTRDLWKQGVKPQVLLQMPMLAKLYDGRRFVWRDGKTITQTVKYQEVDSLYQAYTVGTPMNGGRVQNKTKPWFYSKLAQIPITWDVDEELYNVSGGENSPVDLAASRVEDAVLGTRIGLYKAMYDADTTDTGNSFQSIVQALNHDATYGGTTRATTATNKWFQGASLDDTYADQDTAVAISISLIRQMIDKMLENSKQTNASNLMFLMGPANYRKLKSQVDSTMHYTPGPMNVKYGFDSFTLDGAEVVKDYYLTANNLSAETTPEKWVFGLNIPDWEFAIHPNRNFKLTPFRWQAEVAGGTDSWLARVLLGGNLICWKPNGSIWRSNVS